VVETFKQSCPQEIPQQIASVFGRIERAAKEALVWAVTGG
jgi:hypothetical protein